MHILSSCFELLLETSPLEFANALSPDRRSKQASEDACTGPAFLDSLIKAKGKLLEVKDQVTLIDAIARHDFLNHPCSSVIISFTRKLKQ